MDIVDEGHFPTLGAATASLHPNTARQKRPRLRLSAAKVEELDGQFTTSPLACAAALSS